TDPPSASGELEPVEENPTAPADTAAENTPTPEGTAPETDATSPIDEMLASIPLLDDATDLYKSSDTGQTYTTQKGLEEAVIYYRSVLPELGWTYDLEASVAGSHDVFKKEGFELMLQIYGSNNQRVVTMNLHPLENPQEAAQEGGMLYPEDALVIDFFQKGDSEDFNGEFLTTLSFDELVAFYEQAYPPEAGWRLIPYPPSENAFADGDRGDFYIQGDTRKFEFYMKLAEDGRTSVSFYYRPLTDFQGVNLPVETVDLVSLVGDARDVSVVNMDQSIYIVFFSNKPLEEVIGLYRDGVGNLGWQIVGEDTMGSGATTFYLEKEGIRWNLIMDADFSSTTITLISK
ncbi:MAG TPA: hypothetical protein PK530_19940, partial [Anaerolineales bacterium]|nr:hypothetical protein [Anaerolineales bacterium]